MAVAANDELRVVNPATLELVGRVTTTEPAAVQEVVTEAKLAGVALILVGIVFLGFGNAVK